MAARYLELRDQLLREIDTTFSPGDRFHTQRALMQRHGLGYNTVERALNMLVDDGLLVRQQGRGSFVAARSAPRSQTVGMLVPDVANPFYAPIVDAALAAARERGFDVILRSGGERPDQEQEGLGDLLRNDRVAGLLLCPQNRRCRSPLLTRIRRRKLPCVLFPSLDFVAAATWDYVVTDDEQGAHLATSHLLERGCRRIAFAAPDDQDDPRVANRLAGHLRALREADLGFDQARWIRVPDLERSGGHEASRAVADLAEAIDGIFAINDLIAIGLLLGLREGGLAVGAGGLKLIGFDDHDMAAWPEIDLSSVRQDRRGIGRRAMDLLIDRCQERPVPSAQIVLRAKLVARSTTR